MGKEPDQTLLQGGHTEGSWPYERMLNITSHQRDANLIHNETPLHTSQNGHHKQILKTTTTTTTTTKKTSGCEAVEKREP